MLFDGVFGILELVDEHGNQRHEYRVRKSSVTLGRAASSDVRLLLEEVSRNHCAIEFEGKNKPHLRVHGANGVILNGKHIAPCDERLPLTDGDYLQISQHHLRYKHAEELPAPTIHTPRRRARLAPAAPVRQSPRLKARASMPQLAKQASPAPATPRQEPDESMPSMHFELMEAASSDPDGKSPKRSKSSVCLSPRTPQLSPKKNRKVSLRTATLLKSCEKYPEVFAPCEPEAKAEKEEEEEELQVDRSLELTPVPRQNTSIAASEQSMQLESSVGPASTTPEISSHSYVEHDTLSSSPPLTLADLEATGKEQSTAPVASALTADAPVFNTPQPIKKSRTPRPSDIPEIQKPMQQHRTSFSWLPDLFSPSKYRKQEDMPAERPATSEVSMSLVTESSGSNDSFQDSVTWREEGELGHASNGPSPTCSEKLFEINHDSRREMVQHPQPEDAGAYAGPPRYNDHKAPEALITAKTQEFPQEVPDIAATRADPCAPADPVVPEVPDLPGVPEITCINESGSTDVDGTPRNDEAPDTKETREAFDTIEAREIHRDSEVDKTNETDNAPSIPKPEAAEAIDIRDTLVVHEDPEAHEVPEDNKSSETSAVHNIPKVHDAPGTPKVPKSPQAPETHEAHAFLTDVPLNQTPVVPGDAHDKASAKSQIITHIAAAGSYTAPDSQDNKHLTPDLACLKHVFSEPKHVPTPDIRHFMRHQEREVIDAADMSMAHEMNELLQTPEVRRSVRINKNVTRPLARRAAKEPFVPTRRMNTRAAAQNEARNITRHTSRLPTAAARQRGTTSRVPAYTGMRSSVGIPHAHKKFTDDH